MNFFKRFFTNNKKIVKSAVAGLLITAGVPVYIAMPSSEIITNTVETELVTK